MKAIVRCLCGKTHKMDIEACSPKKCSCGVVLEILKNGRGQVFPNAVVEDFQRTRHNKPKVMGWCE